jgi:putative ATP-dependent endonuclease of the OLD family
LVEGDTEKLALPQYAKRINLDLDREGATIVEVGGKRNLLEFARIAASFGIPTGILYDEDSSDFKDDKHGETQYSAELDALPTTSPLLKVWRLSKTYEHVLKATVGDEKYQALCQKFPSVGKPTRARLIAMENDLPVPQTLQEVLNWLAGKQIPAAAEEAHIGLRNYST